MSDPSLGWSVGLVLADPAAEIVPLDSLLESVTGSPLLQAATDPSSADLRVEMQANSIYRIYWQDQVLAMLRIPVKRPQSLPGRLQRILEHIAAYQNLLRLAPPNDALKSAIQVEFFELTEPASQRAAAEVAPLLTNEAGEFILKSGHNLAIAFSHRLPTPLNCYVTSLNSQQQSSSLVFPYQRSLPAKVKPGEPLLIGSGPKYLLEMQLNPGESNGLDIFQIWVSATTIEPGVMLLPSLGQPLEPPTDPYGTGSRLDRDLRRSIWGQGGKTTPPEFSEDPWWCQQQWIRVVEG